MALKAATTIGVFGGNPQAENGVEPRGADQEGQGVWYCPGAARRRRDAVARWVAEKENGELPRRGFELNGR